MYVSPKVRLTLGSLKYYITQDLINHTSGPSVCSCKFQYATYMSSNTCIL